MNQRSSIGYELPQCSTSCLFENSGVVNNNITPVKFISQIYNSDHASQIYSSPEETDAVVMYQNSCLCSFLRKSDRRNVGGTVLSSGFLDVETQQSAGVSLDFLYQSLNR